MKQFNAAAMGVLLLCAAHFLIAEQEVKKQPSNTGNTAPQTAPSTQSAPATQSRPKADAGDDEVRVIEETPASKSKAVTIETPLGMKEGSERRNETYTKISKKAKDGVVQERRAVEKSDQASSDAEQKPPQP